MGIIAWIILGLVAGVVARKLAPGRVSGGLFVSLIVGVAGAIVGGLIANAIHFGTISSLWSLRTWIVAIGGAIVVLLVWGVLQGRRK